MVQNGCVENVAAYDTPKTEEGHGLAVRLVVDEQFLD
jgi:hypothetical protein